ncbi:MAG: glutathione S-transferase family protein [Caulobacterales bacterium]
MSDDLVFYTHPMSRGRIVRWMLEEVGAPYSTQILDYATTMKAPAYLAINPMGKAPAIRHGDTVVTEAAAICAYLADAFPEAGLAPPPGDKQRGPYFRWMFFAAGPLEADTSTRSLGFQIKPEQHRMAGWGCHEDVLTGLETAISGRDFILGDRFSAADVYFGSHVSWGMQMRALEKRPVFEAYAARLAARPANARAARIDDALMPA